MFYIFLDYHIGGPGTNQVLFFSLMCTKVGEFPRIGEYLACSLTKEAKMPLGISARWHCYPMPGSIYTAPDILNVVRGPTLVRVRDKREPMRVPAMAKASHAPANVHDHQEQDEKTMLLRRILSGIDPSYKSSAGGAQQQFKRQFDQQQNVQPRPVGVV